MGTRATQGILPAPGAWDGMLQKISRFSDTLRTAKADPEAHRGLIVRVAGYSDYFCDLSEALQDEIITRTEHAGF